MFLLKKLMVVSCAFALVLGLAACSDSVRKAVVDVVDTAAEELATVTRAIKVAQDAVAALSGVSTDADVAAASAAIAAARQAVTDADTLDSAAKDEFSDLIDRIDRSLVLARDERRRAVGRLSAALGGDGISDIRVVVRHGAAPTMAGTVPGTPAVAVTGLETEAVAGSALTAGGWTSGKYKATDGATGPVDTVALYTNIEAPGMQPFSGDTGKYSDRLDDEGNLPIVAGVDPTLIASSAFPTGPGIRTHPAEASGVVEVAGIFDGARGTYVCTPSVASDCTSSVRDGGGIQLLGGWKFVPAAGAEVTKRDTEYQYFGWWLRAGSRYAFGAFHAGVGAAAGEFASLAQLQGTATYRGPAAGMFALQPQGATATWGEFTARATLEVDFGNDVVPGTVEGTVSDFRVDGRPTSSSWSVTLGEARIGADGGIAAGGTAWSIDGTAGPVPSSPQPEWRGQLHDVNAEGVPGAATGVFEAAYGEVGRMVGAFGATR